MIAALYVEKGGVYYGLPDVDPWDEERDARLYGGPWPVVAHPPCARWCMLAPLPCRKRTWLYCVGCEPAALDWSEPPALASVSDWGPGNSRRRGEDWQPGIQYDEASRSPLSFRDVLLALAQTASPA